MLKELGLYLNTSEGLKFLVWLNAFAFLSGLATIMFGNPSAVTYIITPVNGLLIHYYVKLFQSKQE